MHTDTINLDLSECYYLSVMKVLKIEQEAYIMAIYCKSRATIVAEIPIKKIEYYLMRVIYDYAGIDVISTRELESKLIDLGIKVSFFTVKNTVAFCRANFVKLISLCNDSEQVVINSSDLIKNKFGKGFYFGYNKYSMPLKKISFECSRKKNTLEQVKTIFVFKWKSMLLSLFAALTLSLFSIIVFSYYQALNLSLKTSNYAREVGQFLSNIEGVDCSTIARPLEIPTIGNLAYGIYLQEGKKCYFHNGFGSYYNVSSVGVKDLKKNKLYTYAYWQLENGTYYHFTNIKKLESRYNSWTSGTIFGGVSVEVNGKVLLSQGVNNGLSYKFDDLPANVNVEYYFDYQSVAIWFFMLFSLYFTLCLNKFFLFVKALSVLKNMRYKVEPIVNIDEGGSVSGFYYGEVLSKNEHLGILKSLPILRRGNYLGMYTIEMIEDIDCYIQKSERDVKYGLNLCPSVIKYDWCQLYKTISNLKNKDKLIIEITEDSSIEYGEELVDKINTLSSLGITVGFDDFGEGNNNINMLDVLDVKFIKFSREYIFNKDGALKENSICFMKLVRELYAVKIICEGVETKEQSNQLSKHGLNVQQGYLFSSV
ncbi:EAL domain-containing protein [Vibrio sp. 10N.261.51.A3]|uniref:EAL domain-containing protein n=1 Tax=unclassified Vibrio TaxID=2614977 RepID=UPI00354CA6F0